MNMPEIFTYQVTIIWDPEAKAYLAKVPAIKNCLAYGDTGAKAWAEVVEAATAMLQVLKDIGRPVPPPP